MTAAPAPIAPDTSQGGAFTAAGLLFGAMTVLCWASYNVAAKEGIDAGFAPVDLALLRFGVAGLVLGPLLLFGLRWRGRLPNWRQTLALGLLGGPLFSILAVTGYKFAPLTHGILFAPAANFIVGSLLGVLWLHEKVGRRHLVGGAVMLTGLAVLSGFDAATLGPETLKGDALFLATGSIWALFTALTRRWRIDPIAGVLAQGTLAAVLAPLVWIAIGGGVIFAMPWEQVAGQAVMQGIVGGLGSAFAFFGAVAALGAARASLLGPMVPVAAVAMAAAWHMAAPRWVDLAGVALVTLGLIVATVTPRPFRSRPPT